MIARYLIVVAAVIGGGCGGKARSTTTYRDDTQRLLETRAPSLKGCFDAALAADRSLTGTVKLRFIVARKTGVITNVTLDTAATTAPPAMSSCVLHAIEGLKLEPPDRNEGRATFVYDFRRVAT